MTLTWSTGNLVLFFLKVLYGTVPIIQDLKVFECLAYATPLVAHRQKLGPRARQRVFLGYKPRNKGYVLFDKISKAICTSRHVISYEHKFPSKPPQPESTGISATLNSFPLPILSLHGEGLFPIEPPIQPTTNNDASLDSSIPIPPAHITPRIISQRIRKPPPYLSAYHHSL